jgi:hypothetical protein
MRRTVRQTMKRVLLVGWLALVGTLVFVGAIHLLLLGYDAVPKIHALIPDGFAVLVALLIVILAVCMHFHPGYTVASFRSKKGHWIEIGKSPVNRTRDGGAGGENGGSGADSNHSDPNQSRP